MIKTQCQSCMLYFRFNLIGVQERAKPVLDAEHVVADGVQVRALDKGTDVDGRGHDDAVRVQTGEVQGSSGLELGGVEAVADHTDVRSASIHTVGHVAEWRVVVLGQVHVGGQVAELSNVHAVHLGLEHVILDQLRVDALGAIALVIGVARKGQELDRLSQGQLLHRLGTHNDRALDLGNQQILGRVGKVVALGLIQIGEITPRNVLEFVVVCGVGCGVEIRCARQVGRPGNTQLHIVELEGNQGQSNGPILVEEELQGVEARDGVIGAQVVTRIADQVALAVVLGASHWLDLGRVGDVLGVDNLTTDHELNFVNHVGPIDDWNQRTVTVTSRHVDVVEQITLLLKTDGGDTAGDGGALDHLTLHGAGVMSITPVA